MLQRVKEVQESDLRMDGALARNIQRVLAVTQADIDAAAAQGKGWLVKRVVKVNDPLDNLRGGTQLVIKQNSIQPGKNVMRVLYTGSGKTVGPAVAPLSLPGAAADDILSLIAFGGTMQGVPDGYTQLAYIESTGTQFLDTNVVPTINTKAEVKFAPMATDSVGYWGVRQDPSRFCCTTFVSGGYFGIGMTSGSWPANRTQIVIGDVYDCVMSNGYASVNGTEYTETPVTTFSTTVTFKLSRLNNPNFNPRARYYGCKLWDSDVLVFNGIPAKDTNNAIGMYDTVSGQFFTSGTTDSFVAGPTAPTPDAPIDIVCNNGALKFTANEANYIADNVTLGYWIRNNNGQPESSPANFYTAMMPVSPNVSYVCFGRNKETDAISGYNRIAWYDADGVWIRNSTYTQNQPGIDVAPSNAAFARFHCNINGTDVTQELVDSYNWVFQQGTTEVPYTPYSPTKVYTAGPVETIAIKDDQSATVSTATCEDLLSVGTYTDEQEIISGVVTRSVGVKVFDGTEDWTYSEPNTYGIANITGTITGKVDGNTNKFICSHFVPQTSAWTGTQTEGVLNGNSNNQVFFRVLGTRIPSLAAWQQWLAAQYAAGTPVIVLYPLATPTTDTVTPQPMQTAAGDNTAEITQAGMAGLELEVEYVEA